MKVLADRCAKMEQEKKNEDDKKRPTVVYPLNARSTHMGFRYAYDGITHRKFDD